jgi:hypothetical protein
MGYYSWQTGHKTTRARIDALIDWYGKFKPGEGQRIPVDITPTGLAQILKHEFGRDEKGKRVVVKEIEYRKRTLVATRPHKQ